MKPTFYKDIDFETSSNMFIASQVVYDLKAFNEYINSLLMSNDTDNIVLARDLLDTLIVTIKCWPDENEQN